MGAPYELQINGERVRIAAPDHWTLLEVLRYELGLTGAKQGCDKGDCGACTVLAAGEPVLACCMVARTCVDRPITTIEGLADADGPTSLQRAFDACGALQCGFCQTGMILSASALLERNPTPSDGEIREALSGNLCRCTGYTKIFEAVAAAVDKRKTPAFAGAEAGPFPRSVPIAMGEPAKGFRFIGSRGRKADAIGKATGATQYTDDIALPRMAHGKILRSPHPHARILSLDTVEGRGAARRVRGGHRPRAAQALLRDPLDPATRHAMAIDKVRHVGDAVACGGRGRRGHGQPRRMDAHRGRVRGARGRSPSCPQKPSTPGRAADPRDATGRTARSARTTSARPWPSSFGEVDDGDR